MFNASSKGPPKLRTNSLVNSMNRNKSPSPSKILSQNKDPLYVKYRPIIRQLERASEMNGDNILKDVETALDNATNQMPFIKNNNFQPSFNTLASSAGQEETKVEDSDVRIKSLETQMTQM